MKDIEHHIDQVIIQSDFIKHLYLLKRTHFSKKKGSGLTFFNFMLEVRGEEIKNSMDQKVPHDLVITSFYLFTIKVRCLITGVSWFLKPCFLSHRDLFFLPHLGSLNNQL